MLWLDYAKTHLARLELLVVAQGAVHHPLLYISIGGNAFLEHAKCFMCVKKANAKVKKKCYPS